MQVIDVLCGMFHLDLVFGVNLLRWPLSEVTQGQIQRAKGWQRWQFVFLKWSCDQSFLGKGLKGYQQPKLPLCLSYVFGTDKLYNPFYVKFIWTWSQNISSYHSPDEELQGLIRLHTGLSPYLSLGMAHSQQSPELDPCPWPLLSAAELCLFKNQT